MSQALMSDRAIIADNIFEQCTLPEGMVIEAFNGWETTYGPAVEKTVNVWKRDVYLENQEDEGGPTIHHLFQVWFYPNSVQVKEVVLGQYTIKVPAPY